MSAACARCLLNDDIPGVRIGTDHICSVCTQHDKRWGDWEQHKAERLSALERMFDDCRRKRRPYDVLVPLSGGKDSVYVLYLCRKRFNLKCLAVTWDNGFLTEHARHNIKNAVDTLEVDHIYYGVNRQLLMRLYRFFFLKTGMFCPVCMRGIGVATEMAASAFDVPLVVNGTSARTEEYVAPEFFQSGPPDFFRNVLKGDPLETEAWALMYRGHWKRIVSYHLFWWTKIERIFGSAVICLPNYVDWNYDEMFQRITSELGWKADRPNAEHGDCELEGIVQYVRQRKFPALTPELLRFSKLVTAGLMSRDEALRNVSERRNGIREPGNLSWFLGALDLSEAEFEHVLREPLRHRRFRKEPGLLWRGCRATKRRVLNPLLGIGK
ncbi:MAG: hypothetical protein WBE26_20440 [Phycisphaerae bacterium]